MYNIIKEGLEERKDTGNVTYIHFVNSQQQISDSGTLFDGNGHQTKTLDGKHGSLSLQRNRLSRLREQECLC